MTSTNEQAKAWKDEESRQSAILAKAIDEAIHNASGAFAAPILNAVAGAVVSIEASILAAVEDPRQRKELRKAMDRARPRALAEALTRPSNKHVQTVILGGIRQ